MTDLHVPVVPLPIALYEWNGLVFELYLGGQQYYPVSIRWERLKTVTVTREDNRDHNVSISQGQQEITAEKGHGRDGIS